MHDLIVQVLFYAFAALAVSSALMVITQNNPVRCVLFLVVTFFASSALWLMLSAEFLALILVLVYVGAVMTLFLFVVMMLNIDTESMRSHFTRYLPFGLILVALLVGLLLISEPASWFKDSSQAQRASAEPTQIIDNNADDSDDIMYPAPVSTPSNTEQIGMVLYTDYVFAFELASVLLLVAIIAAITLAHRGAIRSKRQDITGQIMTRKQDRVKLVSLKAEK
ncbi:NADH-quinone oxidoreductase subunit J [Legionella dresdenensis]|uniref:NADH-quinone oxidoreductase subunit J n=1 Tax=Legionella dresdenensis TaxID=450200 RepID=A0ABV8CF01_9GAMM